MEDEYKYKASCPICGRNLFRGSPESVIEGNCPKCGNDLIIRYMNTGVAVTVSVSDVKQEKNIKMNMPKR